MNCKIKILNLKWYLILIVVTITILDNIKVRITIFLMY